MTATFTALAAAALIGTIYPATMTVTDVTDGVVTMETSAGHIYAMDDNDGYLPGDLVALILDDCGTPDDVTDDAIVSARLAGWWADEAGTLYQYEE